MSKEDTNLQTKVKTVYALVSSLSVSGDAVDTIALIRASLRELYQEVSESANHDS